MIHLNTLYRLSPHTEISIFPVTEQFIKSDVLRIICNSREAVGNMSVLQICQDSGSDAEIGGHGFQCVVTRP